MGNEKPGLKTEERILEAATKIFFRDGLQGARMQDIADLAKINRAMLHYYFRDKKSLSKKVIEQTILNFHDSLHDFLDADMSFEEKVDKYIDYQIDLASKNKELFIFALHESLNDKDILNGIFKEKHRSGPFIGQLEEEIKKGNVQPMTSEEFTIFIVSICSFTICGGNVFKMIFNWDDEQWDNFIKSFKQRIPEIIKRSIFTNYNPS